LDNNGAVDLFLSLAAQIAGNSGGALVWLGDGNGKFTALNQPVGPALVFDAADLSGDGKLDCWASLRRTTGTGGQSER